MNLLCCSVLFWLLILKTFGNKVGTEETSLHSLGTDLRLDSQQLAQLNDLGAPAPKYKENRSEVHETKRETMSLTIWNIVLTHNIVFTQI